MATMSDLQRDIQCVRYRYKQGSNSFFFHSFMFMLVENVGGSVNFSFRGDYIVAGNILRVMPIFSAGILGTPHKRPDLEITFTATLLGEQGDIARDVIVRKYFHPDLTPHPQDSGIFLHLGAIAFTLPSPANKAMQLRLSGFYTGNTGIGNFASTVIERIYDIEVEPL